MDRLIGEIERWFLSDPVVLAIGVARIPLL